MMDGGVVGVLVVCVVSVMEKTIRLVYGQNSFLLNGRLFQPIDIFVQCGLTGEVDGWGSNVCSSGVCCFSYGKDYQIGLSLNQQFYSLDWSR